MKKDIKNIQASVRAQLKNKTKESNCSFSEILQYYAIERFLYRLGCSEYADKFILKGALMFTVWQVPERRTTLDIDFATHFDNKIASIERVIKNVCKLPVVPDGLIYDVETIKGYKIKEDAQYEGVRIKFRAFLERTRITMQIDVGFGDIIYPKAKLINYPVILNFPEPHLKVYSAESVISEKFEAMVKFSLLNSRMKDYYDIWLMMRKFDFKGSKLVEALKRTFQHRKTSLPQGKPLFAEEIYDDRSDRQTLWKAFLRKGEIKNAPEKLGTTAREIEKFLIKPLKAIQKDQDFNEEWKAGKSWK